MPLHPHLVIGVGGTGGKTVGMMRHYLSEAVRGAGLSKLPTGWQFLHIDVAAQVDAHDHDLHYDLPQTAYVPLTTNYSVYTNLHDEIAHTLQTQGIKRHVAWECWRPEPPAAVQVPIHLGAGQFRTLGRVAAVAGLDTIATAIGGALQTLAAPTVPEGLAEVQRALGQEVRIGDAPPVVFVTGSLAGGSGSGMMLDVCDVVRALGGTPIGIAFAPDVFERPDGSMDPGIAPNTFMAISELSNAMWRIDALDPLESRGLLFDRAKVSRPPSNEAGGPETLFIIGRSNGSMTLEAPADVYRVTARTLSEIALDEDLANQMHAYSRTNAAARKAGSSDRLRLSGRPRDYGALTGFGFGRLSLGRDFFGRYAAKRLHRLAVLRLLDHHLSLHFPGDGLTDDQVLAKAAERAWSRFISLPGLDELGSDNNQIQDALNPMPDVREKLEEIRATVKANISVPTKGRSVQVATARSMAARTVRDHCTLSDRATLRALVQSTLLNKVDAWSRDVSARLTTAVTSVLSEWGLPVTIRVLDRLANELDAAAKEIGGKEKEEARRKAEGRLGALETRAQGEKEVVKPQDQVLDLIADHTRITLETHVKVWAATFVEPVIQDLKLNLVMPWRRAVADAEAGLRIDARPLTGVRPIDLLPGSEGVPDHLRPSKVEFCLDDVEAFPETFLRVVGSSVGEGFDVTQGDGVENAVAAVVMQVIAGERLPTRVAHTMRPALYSASWVPEDSGKGTPRRAQLKLQLGWGHLEDRIHHWLHDDAKEVGRHLAENLFDYLGQGTREVDSSDLRSRSNRLIDQFGAALRASRPLLKLDPTFVHAIHTQDLGQVPLKPLVSPIGIPAGMDELRTKLQDTATAQYGAAVQLRFTGVPTNQITIMTTHDIGFHMLEIASIMEPVARQYASAPDLEEFWKYRRSRPVEDWTPLGFSAARALIAGWIAARFLGRARLAGNGTQRHEVWVPVDGLTGQGEWMLLPQTGVRRITGNNQVGILLELAAIAMLTASQRGSMAPLEPFQELIRLGSSLTSRDTTNDLAKWVLSGEGLVDVASSYVRTDPGDVDGRKSLVRERLHKIQSKYEGGVSPQHLADVETAQSTMFAETHRIVSEALTHVREAADVTPVEDADVL